MNKKNYELIKVISEKGTTQARLAIELEIPEAKLSKIINYTANPTKDEIKKISEKLDICKSLVTRKEKRSNLCL